MTRTPNAAHLMQSARRVRRAAHSQRHFRSFGTLRPLSAALLVAGLGSAPGLLAAPTPHVSLINAAADDASAVSNTPTLIDVLANDAGVDKAPGKLKLIDPATGDAVDSITTAESGLLKVVTVNGQDFLEYTPDPARTEYSDSFQYRVVESDWRGTRTVAGQVLDRGTPATVTDDGNSDSISDAGALVAQWPYTGNDQVRYQGRLAGIDAAFELCASGDSNTAILDATVTWGLQKRGGGANDYEASITHNAGSQVHSPLSASGSALAEDWTAISTRNLILNLSGLTPAQYDALTIGLFVENFDTVTGENSWDSLNQSASVTANTSSCSLDSADVTVNMVVDTDSDNDNEPNVSDLDDDNDGIPDIDEGGDTLDSDGDLTPNRLDLDSDGDGLFDIAEAGLGSHDANGDGTLAGAEFTDVDGNGFDDIIDALNVVPLDSDKDQIADFLDLDSDNDGLGDVLESGGIDDDFDGLQDPNTRGIRTPLVLLDIDNDGVPNHVDTDRDNDGIPDLHEAGGKDRFDSANGNGVIDRMENGDGNTLLDAVETSAPGGSGNDADGDGVDDNFDADTNPPDGITTIDGEGDGLLRVEDGISDPDSGLPFTDGDRGDPDDDNNGFDDRFPVGVVVLPDNPVDNEIVDPDPGGNVATGLKGAGSGGPLLLGALALVAALRRRLGRG